jgi:hypothetical protein
MEAQPGKKLVYYFKLLDRARGDKDIKKFEKDLRANSLDNIRADAGLKRYRDNEVSFCYNYVDKNEEELFNLEFLPADYHKK